MKDLYLCRSEQLVYLQVKDWLFKQFESLIKDRILPGVRNKKNKIRLKLLTKEYQMTIRFRVGQTGTKLANT